MSAVEGGELVAEVDLRPDAIEVGEPWEHGPPSALLRGQADTGDPGLEVEIGNGGRVDPEHVAVLLLLRFHRILAVHKMRGQVRGAGDGLQRGSHFFVEPSA